MQITEIESSILRLPDVRAVGDGCQTVLIILVHTDEGITGIGEAHTSPTVSKAIIDAPLGSISSCGLRELLVGQDPRNIDRLCDLMYERTMAYGRRGVTIHTISGIEIALWDILGKWVGQPIHRLLGHSMRSHVKTYASFLAPPTADLAINAAKDYVELGFQALKLGWGDLGRDPKHDVQMVSEVRRAIGQDVDIMLDLGLPVSTAVALELADAVAPHHVYFLEEPVSADDLEGYAVLTRHSPVPIAAGEKESTRFAFRDLMDRGGLRIIQPDVARVGGIAETIRIANDAASRGVTLIPHCWSTDILVAATLHVLATLPEAPYMELNVENNPLRTELLTEPIQATNGQLSIPDRPGLGIELNEDTISRFRWGG